MACEKSAAAANVQIRVGVRFRFFFLNTMILDGITYVLQQLFPRFIKRVLNPGLPPVKATGTTLTSNISLDLLVRGRPLK